ncbi:aspartate aminotransferase family protein [Caulobacter sp. CCUG 60055]|uniref:aspartate aminotransferase family protein n=1 Tax=Caulobacter sp. CCUG 60055 TaxID=2100090 RepID=UPI0003C18A22|nr:aspartate aminotransferase family protein [Caulobacter sp. CCUG 60055]MBQ1542219.1 aspartate aminotransferase family protein [Caulobacteraceae bacterium]MCI3180852.1 aspartate aminotransferase family protein [Caulobacter sp. CCUG 60055]
MTAYPDSASRSAQLHQRARRVMPSGNSRQTIFFKPYPVYARSGEGCRVVDEDGVERIDFLNNYTALIHGHRHPEVMAAARAQLDRLTAVALPTEAEIALAELLVDRLEGVEQVRFANSGTEAVMMAIKAARAYTGRPRIAKIEGAYHGGYDHAEVSQAATPAAWGPADRPASVANYKGQPKGVLDDVVVLPWNDVEASRALLEAHGADLAAVLIDPIPSRLGLVPISEAYLAMLRETARKLGALFILDEVYCLRLGYRGAQGRLGFAPDLTAMAKIIGGGFPVGAVGGKAEVMAVFGFDDGPPRVPHGGTYNANPVTMAAGLAAMRLLTPEAFARLGALGDRLRSGLRECLKITGRDGQVQGAESLTMLSLSDRPFGTYRDTAYAVRFGEPQAAVHRSLMNRGVLTSPSLLFNLSTPMVEADVDFTLEQVLAALKAL